MATRDFDLVPAMQEIRDWSARFARHMMERHHQIDLETDRFCETGLAVAMGGMRKLLLDPKRFDVETVIFAGVLTNQCVAASSKDASFRDFKPIVVPEATGATLPHLHEPALEMMKVGWTSVQGLEAVLPQISALPLGNA